MSRFGDLQDAFQRAVLAGDDGVVETLAPGVRTTTEALLDVYKDAYVLRLIEIVGSDHEQLSAFVGEDAFEQMCRDYIAAHPSHTPNARYYATKFPQFLSRDETYSARKELGELAALEKSLNDAFDCVDAPIVSLQDLGAVPPENWALLSFAGHPSVARLNLTTNAADIWKALKEEGEVPEVQRVPSPVQIIVWRNDTTPMMRILDDEEAMMWDEAAKGVPFGVLCEMAATYQDPDTAPQRAAQYLSGWLSSGMITSFKFADA